MDSHPADAFLSVINNHLGHKTAGTDEHNCDHNDYDCDTKHLDADTDFNYDDDYAHHHCGRHPG